MKSFTGFLSALLLLAFSGQSILAADTAYAALRSLGSQRGPELLKHVIEVKGTDGDPQPHTWKVLLEDKDARSGIREFEIRGQAIVSERTPRSDFAGAVDGSVMDFGRLNLDSSGAFSVAEKEALRSRIGFNTVEYSLSASEDRRPVWTLILLDGNGTAVGRLQLSAEDGRIVRREGFVPGESARADQRPAVDTADETSSSDDGGVLGKMERFGKRVQRHFIRDGAAMEEFFTGKRTIDRNQTPDE